jgi:hypothetical protein
MEKVKVKLGTKASFFFAGGNNKVLPNQVVEVEHNQAVKRGIANEHLVIVNTDTTIVSTDTTEGNDKKTK